MDRMKRRKRQQGNGTPDWSSWEASGRRVEAGAADVWDERESHPLPIDDYDTLAEDDVMAHLDELTLDEVQELLDHELDTRNRQRLVTELERRLEAGEYGDDRYDGEDYEDEPR